MKVGARGCSLHAGKALGKWILNYAAFMRLRSGSLLREGLERWLYSEGKVV
jgi:hypothetical protein